jgi:hypothetical protein
MEATPHRVSLAFVEGALFIADDVGNMMTWIIY